MRLYLIVISIIPLFACAQQSEFRTPLRDVVADSVVAYAFGLTPSGEWADHSESILRGNALVKNVNLGKQCNTSVLEKLFVVIEDSASFGESPASCFIPHHAIVWWKDGKPTELIDICFGCNSMHASLSIPAQAVHSYEETYESSDGTIETYIMWNHGFTTSGRKNLILWFEAIGVGLGLPVPNEKLWEDEDD